MKLTKHQKEIVEKIVNGQVFDISTYLMVFQNYHIEQYDIDELKKKFESDEADKEYKVIKEGFSLWTNQYIDGIAPMTLPVLRFSIPENEYEYQKAKFIDKTPKILYEYNGTKYEYDFSQGVNVINDFNNLIDFLTLWHYLKQESLILELDKQIEKDDVGLFFERVPKKEKNQETEIKIEYDGKELKALGEILDVLEKAPNRFAHDYSDITWEINEERLLMCRDFLGKKIVPTTALRTYACKKFKTKEKISQQTNLFIAICALVVSVVSVVLGNIIPLFKTQNTEKYLKDIHEQLKSIELILTEQMEISESELENIQQSIREIEESLNSLNNKTDQNFEDIEQDILDIKQTISNISNNSNN